MGSFVGKGDASNTFTNRTHFRTCGHVWLSSVQRVRRVGNEEVKKEFPVKHKSADDYMSGRLHLQNVIVSRHEIYTKAYAAARHQPDVSYRAMYMISRNVL